MAQGKKLVGESALIRSCCFRIELARPGSIFPNRPITSSQGRWLDKAFMLPDHEVLLKVVNEGLEGKEQDKSIDQRTRHEPQKRVNALRLCDLLNAHCDAHFHQFVLYRCGTDDMTRS